MRTKELFAFMKERHDVYEQKRLNFSKPWTLDSILQRYRFCNVYRELDTQTQWFADNWRTSNSDDPDLWFASLVFRFINWSETAQELGYPVPWDPKRFKAILKSRKVRGLKVYSGAYMISTHGVKEEKYIYLAKSLSKIWEKREDLRHTIGVPLKVFHKNLMECFDVGSFLAAQVVADIKYVDAILYSAPDWETFAASGPGSRRGLNRVMGFPVGKVINEEDWYLTLIDLKSQIDDLLYKNYMPGMHAQDLQNCLCEFDKYERVRLGEGRPKQKYNGESE